MDDLVERLKALHVWPQFVADHHADTLTSKQIEGLYGVGNVAHEAADRITQVTAERGAALAALWEIAELTERRQLPITSAVNDIARAALDAHQGEA